MAFVVGKFALDRLLCEHFSFTLYVSFKLCCTRFFIIVLLLSEEELGKTCELCKKKSVLFRGGSGFILSCFEGLHARQIFLLFLVWVLENFRFNTLSYLLSPLNFSRDNMP